MRQPPPSRLSSSLLLSSFCCCLSFFFNLKKTLSVESACCFSHRSSSVGEYSFLVLFQQPNRTDRPKSPFCSSCVAFISVWAAINIYPRIVELTRRYTNEGKRRKLAWFEHVTRHDSLSKTILQGTLEGGQRRGRQRQCWMDNIKEWTSLPRPELFTIASCRKQWKRISADSSLKSSRWPNR